MKFIHDISPDKEDAVGIKLMSCFDSFSKNITSTYALLSDHITGATDLAIFILI
jgi:hypothetical protein